MIEQPDSEKPRDEWSDPRTTPASGEAAPQAPLNADPEECNNALAALDAELDAAVDAEPEFAEGFGEVTEIPTDGGTQVWVNVGKATPSTKYKANVGGAIVWAQPIKSLAYDKDLGHYLVLSDGTKQLRPTLHGYNPAVGDYFVQSYKTTLLGDGRTYVEPVETAIVGKALFESLYTATE